MGEKKRILIIEDNERNRKLEKDLLEVAGYEILEAESGEEGIETARKELPDLILLDLRMPGMGGEAAFKILNSDEKTKDIPCVAVTASVAVYRNVEDSLIEEGFAGYVSKPIDTHTFVEKVTKHIK